MNENMQACENLLSTRGCCSIFLTGSAGMFLVKNNKCFVANEDEISSMLRQKQQSRHAITISTWLHLKGGPRAFLSSTRLTLSSILLLVTIVIYALLIGLTQVKGERDSRGQEIPIFDILFSTKVHFEFCLRLILLGS